MEKVDISVAVAKQRQYFNSGKTLDVATRINALKALKNSILKHETDIYNALYTDLNKNRTETYFSELAMTLSEADYMIKHLKAFSKPEKIRTSIMQFPSKGFISPHPYGNVLIISPWNYPLMLCLTPLIGAIAAGNTAVLKPSNYSPATSLVIDKIIKDTFKADYVTVILGGREENAVLLDEKFDYIFFTGSPTVGKLVMEKAAKNLTPVSLELGGKSPVIVDKSVNLAVCAKRIAFGKLLNCGQTCIAPDYVLIDKEIKDDFIKQYISSVKKLYGECPVKSNDYGKIINSKHYNRLINLIDNTKAVYIGGDFNEESLKIPPMIFDNITANDKIMSEEIFGPLLPIITYDKITDAISFIQNRPSPLALYLFSNDKNTISDVLKSCNFGGGCINDTIMHISERKLPFGGVGNSGMGSYHGKKSFETFTHYRSIIKSSDKIDINIRYAPYTKGKAKVIKKFFK